MQMKTEMAAQSNNGYVRHQESEIGNCAWGYGEKHKCRKYSFIHLHVLMMLLSERGSAVHS